MGDMEGSFGCMTNSLAWFGAVAFSACLFKFLRTSWGMFRAFYLAQQMRVGENMRTFGEWAVVTGSTDGIGKSYAHQLAKIGMKIVLISRSPDKLATVAAEIESKYNVKTKVVAIDFTGGPEIYDRIGKELEGLEIGVLVNNVGMNIAHPDFLVNMDVKKIQDIINVNINSVTVLSRMVLPAMIERKKGAILNISSGSACQPTPLLTVYACTKVYVDYFSRALQMECEKDGVIVQSVLPFFVATKMSGIRRASFVVPSPDTYATSAVNTVGVHSRTFGCFSHTLQGNITSLVPEFIAKKVGMRMLLDAKKRYLRKAARANKSQ